MPPTVSGKRFVRQSVSLREDQLDAVKRVIDEDGHGNLSRFIQDLVEDELRRRYGRNWQADFAPVIVANGAVVREAIPA